MEISNHTVKTKFWNEWHIEQILIKKSQRPAAAFQHGGTSQGETRQAFGQPVQQFRIKQIGSVCFMKAGISGGHTKTKSRKHRQ